MKICIIDYGLGNKYSVKLAIEYLGFQVKISNNKEIISEADGIILPGVGSFKDGMDGLKKNDLITPLRQYKKSGRPILGVCLGMQLLMTNSEEFGYHKGLNFISGKVSKLKIKNSTIKKIKIPNIGWSKILPNDYINKKNIFIGFNKNTYMYFAHSFYVIPKNNCNIIAHSMFGDLKFCSFVRDNNVIGVQFHPELSGPEGIQIYEKVFKKNYE